MNDFEWGREQYRTGNHPWSGNLNEAQADGYRWERWVRENEQRRREDEEQRSRPSSPGCSVPDDGASAWAAGGGTGSTGGAGGSAGDAVLPLLILAGAAIWFVLVFWMLVLAVAGVLLLGVAALYCYDLGFKKNRLRALDEVADDALSDAMAWVASWPLSLAQLSKGLAGKAAMAAQARRHREVVADSCTARFRNACLHRIGVSLFRLRLRLARLFCTGAASLLDLTARALYRQVRSS